MDFKSYKLLGFEQGKGNKKYNAVLQDKKIKNIIHVAFGDNIYNDIKRKNNYRTRHKHDKLNEYSPGFFSWYFLWNYQLYKLYKLYNLCK